MLSLCRHILTEGRHCRQPAIKGTLLCRFHGVQRKLTARPKYYGSITIPFVFPEDRAAVQLNLHLIALATIEGRIEPPVARALTNVYRACGINLKAGPLLEPNQEDSIQRVILTPEGEEISTPREMLEPNETLAHSPECPCARCAETYRNAPQEQHHANCKCGLCNNAASGGAQSVPGDQPPPTTADVIPSGAQPDPHGQVFVRKADSAESKDLDFQNQPGHEIGHPLSPADVGEVESRPSLQSVPAGTLYNEEPGSLPDPDNPDESPYKKVIREYYARQDAIAAGKIPAPVPDPNQPVPEGIRRYNETMAEVERNKQAAQKSWELFVAREAAAGRTVEDPAENDPYFGLTWNEQEALRRAEWQKQKEEEQARAREG